MSTLYIDNKVLYENLSDWINRRKLAIKNSDPIPPISDYLGSAILLLANKLASRGNFSGYTYRDDMVGDAVESCLRYLHNFNPQKSTNAFAYLTQVIYNAFVRRIQKERKVTFTKAMLIRANAIHSFDVQDGDHGDYRNTHIEFLHENVDDIIEKYETAKTKKKERQKARKSTIEELFVTEPPTTE